MSVFKSVLQQIHSLQHLLALLALETSGDVDSTISFQENIDHHPVGFMLRLFIRRIVHCETNELENIR